MKIFSLQIIFIYNIEAKQKIKEGNMKKYILGSTIATITALPVLSCGKTTTTEVKEKSSLDFSVEGYADDSYDAAKQIISDMWFQLISTKKTSELKVKIEDVSFFETKALNTILNELGISVEVEQLPKLLIHGYDLVLHDEGNESSWKVSLHINVDERVEKLVFYFNSYEESNNSNIAIGFRKALLDLNTHYTKRVSSKRSSEWNEIRSWQNSTWNEFINTVKTSYGINISMPKPNGLTSVQWSMDFDAYSSFGKAHNKDSVCTLNVQFKNETVTVINNHNSLFRPWILSSDAVADEEKMIENTVEVFNNLVENLRYEYSILTRPNHKNKALTKGEIIGVAESGIGLAFMWELKLYEMRLDVRFSFEVAEDIDQNAEEVKYKIVVKKGKISMTTEKSLTLFTV